MFYLDPVDDLLHFYLRRCKNLHNISWRRICKLLSKNRSSVFCIGLKFEALSPTLNPDDTKGRRLKLETKRNETPEYKTVRHKEHAALTSSSHGPIFQSWEVVLPTSVCSRASCGNVGATWTLKRGRFAQYVTLVDVSYHQHQLKLSPSFPSSGSDLRGFSHRL